MSWKREPLEDNETEELIDAAAERSLQDEFIIRVLCHTGLRAGEFAEMRSTWVNWQREELRVPLEQDDWSPKTESGARTIPVVDPDTLRVMREWFKRNDATNMSRATVYRHVVDVAADTGIQKKVTPHVLRHTYGTTIAHRGASAAFIRDTMGHADISSSQKYIKFSGRRLQEEAKEVWG